MLKLAEALRDVSEASQRRRISRTQFYECKRRFQPHGIEGLKDLLPIPKSHPMTKPKEVRQRIVQMRLSHPAYGCNHISDQLTLEGISLNAPTVQNILNKEGLGTRYERWLKLEEKLAAQHIEYSLLNRSPLSRSTTLNSRSVV